MCIASVKTTGCMHQRSLVMIRGLIEHWDKLQMAGLIATIIKRFKNSISELANSVYFNHFTSADDSKLLIRGSKLIHVIGTYDLNVLVQ